MELELGLKVKNVADELTSEFQITKDRAGPIFTWRETETCFILTANLKGYKRGDIKIDINEDGSLIGISGERRVKERVIVGWKGYQKDTEIKGFKKTYRIPDGVILDKTRAKFNEEESILTITMPKKDEGVVGAAIEEVKDQTELVKEDEHQERPPSVENTNEIQEINEDQEVAESLSMKQDEKKDPGETVDDERSTGNVEDGEEKGRFRICIPIVAGSTLLLTFVALVIQIIRSKHQTSRRRD